MSRIDEIEVARAKVSTLPVPELEPDRLADRLKTIQIRGSRRMHIKCHEWAKVLLALPPDAEIEGIMEADYRSCVAILVRSREFDPVEEGELPPTIQVNVTRQEVDLGGGQRSFQETYSLGV